MLLGQPAQEQAQQSAAPKQQLPDGPKPQIPDAPKPQLLPDDVVVPGRGATPDSPGNTSSTSQYSSVPGKLRDSAAAQKPDDGQQPEVPAPGQGPEAFTLTVRTNF